MTYTVAWATPAQRDMSRLPPRIAVVVLTYVDERLADNPMKHSKALRGALTGLYSARSGDYRILFKLDAPVNRIIIIRVDHRAHVYGRR